MSARVLYGTFKDEGDILGATREAREGGFRIVDVYTPYAVHGIEKAMGLKPSRLGIVCFAFGFAGAALALWIQYWTSAEDWPLNIGGKPFNSLPAFVPIMFEITVLFAGLGTVAVLFARCKLWPGRRARVPGPRVTNDRFCLVVQLDSAALMPGDFYALCERHHAENVEEHVEEVRS